jgi:hypothetical protein
MHAAVFLVEELVLGQAEHGVSFDPNPRERFQVLERGAEEGGHSDPEPRGSFQVLVYVSPLLLADHWKSFG